jgi:hypothetical protein
MLCLCTLFEANIYMIGMDRINMRTTINAIYPIRISAFVDCYLLTCWVRSDLRLSYVLGG